MLPSFTISLVIIKSRTIRDRWDVLYAQQISSFYRCFICVLFLIKLRWPNNNLRVDRVRIIWLRQFWRWTALKTFCHCYVFQRKTLQNLAKNEHCKYQKIHENYACFEKLVMVAGLSGVQFGLRSYESSDDIICYFQHWAQAIKAYKGVRQHSTWLSCVVWFPEETRIFLHTSDHTIILAIVSVVALMAYKSCLSAPFWLV